MSKVTHSWPGVARKRTPTRRAAVGLALVFMVALGGSPALAHDVVPPRIVSQPPAEWPGGRVGEHDVVVPVTLDVLADGSVAQVRIDARINPEFDGAAIAAAKRWKYEPATRQNQPLPTRIREVVRFVSGAPRAPGLALPGGAVKAGQAPGISPGTVKAGQDPRTSPKTAPPGAASPAQPGAPGETADPATKPPIAVTVEGTQPPRSASETVRDRVALRAAPHRTASDLLSVVPGVFVTQHSGEGKAHQIFLRGFDAVHGQDVELWVAGAPVNEVSNVHGQGYADLHFIMPEVVDELHATPGTFDPRQGDFAVAGTVRYALGYDEPGVTAKGSLGTFGARRLFLAYHPQSQPDETFAAFETYSTDGFGPGRAASHNSLIGQATYEFAAGISARLMASTYAGRFGSAGVLRLSDIQSGAVDPFDSYDTKQGGYSSRSQIVLEIRRDSEDSRLAFAPFFIARSLRLRSNFTGFLTDPVNGDSLQQLNDALTVGATGYYRRKLPIFSDRDTVEAGIFARNDWIEQSQRRLSTVDDHVTANLVDAKVRATDVAGYADASLHPLRRLTVRGGLRVDGLSYATENQLEESGGQARAALGTHFGGKGTVDVLVAPGLRALASIGQGFRSPQARSLGEGETAPFTEVLSFELGLRYGREKLEAHAAGFYTTLSEDLVFDEATSRNETVPSTARAGFALDFTARPTPWLSNTSSLTYTRAAFTASDARFAEGDLLPYAPQLVARTDLSVTPTLMRIGSRKLEGHLGLGITFLHGRPLPFGELGRDILLADASAAVRFDRVEIGAEVYNLLDARHYDGEFVYASAFDRGASAALVPARHVTVGAPISALFSLSIFI